MTKEEQRRRQRIANKKWRASHTAEARAATRRWQQQHPEWSRAWRKNNLDTVNRIRRAWQRKVRLEVLAAYGNQCACCGETEEAFLTIDHKDGDGAAHRRKIGYRWIYGWLKKRSFPQDNFQILCANCQMGKERPGGCPHQHENKGNKS